MAITISRQITRENRMFSGIVEGLGTIIQLSLSEGCKHFVIAPEQPFDDLTVGDSVSVNGVCLTVTSFTSDTFHVTAVPETLRLTNLDYLAEGEKVNLERAMKLNARVGGHYVQGHVDGTGEILEIEHDNSNALLVKIGMPQAFAKYMVNKGYIAIDGMSITIINATPEWFTVTFIPHTQAVTVVNQYKKGTKVNLEVDMAAKQLEKLLGAYANVATK
jgi:riboflavin synthase